MRLSLATRLAMVIVALVLVTIGVLGMILGRSTRERFLDVQREETVTIGAGQMEKVLREPMEHAYDQGGWEVVQEFLDNDPRSAIAQRRFRVFVIDDELRIVAAKPQWFTRLTVERTSAGAYRIFGRPNGSHETEIVVHGGLPMRDGARESMATLLALPENENEEEQAASDFVSDVWRIASLWLVGCVTLAVGAILLLIRRTLSPIERLTAAANQLSAGEIPELVPPAKGPEFNALIDAFNEAINALQRNDELRKQLVSDIAHELRTPLTNIKSVLEASDAGLLDGVESMEQLLAVEAGILERLVNDFQQLALSDAGQLPIHASVLPLRDVIEASLVPLRRLRHDMTAMIDVPRDLFVVADADRLRQVLANLFENSSRHQPHDLRLVIRAERRSERVVISVLDNGPGIAGSDRPRVFQRFYRGEPSRSRATGGSGLGLAIARALMQAMGGSIRLGDSKSGTRMVLELPSAIRIISASYLAK